MRNNKKLYHIYLFTFGFIYYIITPFISTYNGLFYDFPGMQNVYENYNNNINMLYIYICVCFYFSFIFGSILPLKAIKYTSYDIGKEFILSNKDIFRILLLLYIIAHILIIKNFNMLFTGYSNGVDSVFSGGISTINIIFVFFLIYSKLKYVYSPILVKFITFTIVELSIVLAGLGSRMYIFIPIIIYFIYLYEKQLVSLKKILFRGSLVIIFLLLIGLWRGGSDISIEGLFFIGIAEPMFTWITAVSMFSMNDELPIVSIPANFISSIINFIPSVFFPNKADYIYDISLEYESPLGATNVLVSLISNFGILGSCIALFILGFFFTYLRYNSKTVFAKTYYICICGIIPFQLFRDDFAIVNKMFFYNCFIVPFLIIVISKIICSKYGKGNQKL